MRPIGLSGRKERGEIVELSLEDAQNIGGEYLKPVSVDSWGRVSDNSDVVLSNVELTSKAGSAAEESAKAQAKAAEEAAEAERIAAEKQAEEESAKEREAKAAEEADADGSV